MAPFILGHTNAPRGFCDLPQELIDKIIDLHRNDMATLHACSLTHSCMRPRAQSCIYRTIHFTPSRWAEADELARETPHLAAAVRCLYVTQHGDAMMQEYKYSSSALGYGKFVGSQSWETPPMFPAVQNLQLELLADIALSPLLLSMICDLRQVETLHLRVCLVATLRVITDLVGYCPRLRSLTLRGMIVVDTFMPDPEGKVTYTVTCPVEPTARPAIEELRLPCDLFIGEISSMGLTKWIFEQGMQVRLSTLEIAVSQRADAIALNDCLRELGPCLQHLYLTVEQLKLDGESSSLPRRTPLTRMAASFSDPLTLSSNSGLRTLAFHGLKLHADTESRRPRPSLAWVPRLLTELSSSVLEHLHLQFRAGGAAPVDLHTLDWDAINDILCGQRFNSLRQVDIELIRGSSIQEAFWVHVEERLFQLRQRCKVKYISMVA